MAAFNNSPGGCCCTVPGWFPSYSSTTFTGDPLRQFQRYTGGMLQIGAARNDGSEATTGWVIPSTPQLEWFSACRSDTRVWSIGRESTNGEWYLSLYDAILETMLWRKRIADWLIFDQTFFIRFGLPSQLAIPTGLDERVGQIGVGARMNATTLVEPVRDRLAYNFTLPDDPGGPLFFGWRMEFAFISEAGNLNQWPLLPATFASRRVENGGYVYDQESLDLAADLEWPRATDVRKSSAGRTLFGLPHTTRPYIEFRRGNVTNTGAELRLGGPSVVVRRDAAQLARGPLEGNWLAYDERDGHWCGILYYREESAFGFNAVRYEVYIDGVNVISYRWPQGTTLITNDFERVLVLHPHETLGDGYIAFVALSFDTPPSDSFPNGSGMSYKLHLYKNTNLVWSKTVVGGAALYGSSDRWLHVRAGPTSFADFTGGIYTVHPPDRTPTDTQWLIRHDGSEVLPCLGMTNTYRQFDGFSFSYVTPYGFVQNSAAIPNNIPGSYEEMWNDRQAT